MFKLEMKNIKRIIKTLFVVLVIFSNITSFAAIVSDNDGVAFVTKVEFDTLKRDFAEQVTNYNNSIDNKIDGAIAEYLSGRGINSVELISKVNSCRGQKFGENTNFGIDPNIPGTYRQFSMSWSMELMAIGSGPRGTALHWLITTNGLATKDSSADKGNYWIVHPSTFDNTKYEIDYLLKDSYPVVISGGARFRNDNWIYAGGATAPTGDWGLIAKTSPAGTTAVTLSGNFHNNTKDTINGFYTLTWNETRVNALTCLAYGAMTTGNKTNILVSDLFTVGEECAVDNPTTGYCRYGWNSENLNDTAICKVTNFKLHSYHRYYNHVTNVSVDTIINPITSSVYGQSLTYYEGMPMLKTTDDGDLTFKLKASNTSSGDTYIQIKKDKFGNAAITKGIAVTGAKDIKVFDETGLDVTSTWNGTIGHDKTLTFEITGMPKGTYLFLKAQPATASSYTSFETVGKIELVPEG